MMRDSGLGDIELLNYLGHGTPAAASELHNLLAGIVGNGFGKEYGIKGGCRRHIDILLCIII